MYQYFSNKQALLYALAERHLEFAISRLDATFEFLRRSQAPFEDTVRGFVTELVKLHDDRPALHTLIHVYTLRVPELVARVETLNERAIGELLA